jgi:hypothetical protein
MLNTFGRIPGGKGNGSLSAPRSRQQRTLTPDVVYLPESTSYY